MFKSSHAPVVIAIARWSVPVSAQSPVARSVCIRTVRKPIFVAAPPALASK
jgi:hypothetical protein